jgi:Putative restriction endonuclease
MIVSISFSNLVNTEGVPVNVTDSTILLPKVKCFFLRPILLLKFYLKKTASKDRGIKKQDYAAHGIREYWIIDPIGQGIEQYILLSPKDKQYAPAKTFGLADEIESYVIKGFNIPIQALFDEAVNVETIQDLLNA